MLSKRWLSVLVVVVLQMSMPQGAWAYSSDVHFNLTYALCKIAGLPTEDALWIAAADQSMDDNDCTTAYGTSTLETVRNVDWDRNGRLWHDFSDAGADPKTLGPLPRKTIVYNDADANHTNGWQARVAIKRRINDIENVWKTAAKLANKDNTSRITADIAFGQFLHTEQDYFSHRQFTDNDIDDNKYFPYGTYWGHSCDGDGHTADRVDLRVPLAKRMIQDSYDYIKEFVGVTQQNTAQASFSDTSLNKLIDALVQAYLNHTVPNNRGGGTHASPDFPTQTEVNLWLLPCLIESFAAAWVGPVKLPTYKAPDNLTLPYDAPETLLKTETVTFLQAADLLNH